MKERVFLKKDEWEEVNSNSKEKILSMENLLSFAGTNRPYNYLIYIFCAWGSFVTPLHMISYQFLGATPNYWCKIPDLLQANWTQHQIIAISVPENKTTYINSCEMWDRNYSLASELGFEKSVEYFGEESEPKIVSCTVREFNASEPITVVSMWDLVCERRAIYSTTQSTVFAGNLIGCLMIGYLSDLFGRRTVYVWSGLGYLVVGLIAAFAPNVTVYIILKITVSMASSAFYMIGLILVLELCSASQRSWAGALFAIPWALGYMVLPSIAYFIRSFTYLQIAITLPILSLLPGYWIVPESPRWLVLKGKFDEAILVLENISKRNKTKLPSKSQMLSAMEKIYKTQDIKSMKKSSSTTLKSEMVAILHKLFKLWTIKSWRFQMPILFFGWFSCALVYYGVSLNPPDLRAGKYMYIFLGGLLEIPAYLMLGPANKYIGRKKSMMILYIISAISIFGTLAITLQNPKDESGILIPGVYRWLLFLSLVGKFAITAAFQLIWVYSIELLPTEFRSVVVGEANVFGKIGSIFSPYIVDLLSEVKVWAPSAIFGSVSLIAGILIIFLPETRNVNLSESTDKNTLSESTDKNTIKTQSETETITNLL